MGKTKMLIEEACCQSCCLILPGPSDKYAEYLLELSTRNMESGPSIHCSLCPR